MKLAKECGWKQAYPIKGTFGMDNMVMSVGRLLVFLSKNANVPEPNKEKSLTSGDSFSLEDAASLVHDAWADNYKHWRDHLPYILQSGTYLSPFKPLGDKERNTMAETKYENLEEIEKVKDRIIANFILRNVSLERGDH